MESWLMLVRCVENRVSSLTDAVIREHVKQHVHLEVIGLDVGRCYQVFGVSFRAGVPWYLICEDINDEYPTPYCSSFFELIDGSFGSGWSLTLSRSNVGEVSILPDEWAKDDRFLEKLVDGEPDAVSYFNNLKVTEAN
jgi:hypothetical protein